ncbi:exocyst complex component 3-like [Haliotis cracherodii]|uniref:exocyst complex component 3-like n=1 Tax=Haliotis cracherodii TaxID=6455 RepID=UPI0039EB254F
MMGDEGHDQGPAPAPLDLGRVETVAREAAMKYVANLLQRPEQLEKVDQFKRRAARKKASVEAMLKTAVQSQLDGVKTGLNQLQSALQDVYEIKQSLDEVDENYRSIQPLHDKLKEVKRENSEFCQLAAAQENLKHIFTVPESVSRTRDLITEGKLLQAHKHLADLEMSRDDLLLELHRQPNQSPTDNNTLKRYFADVEKLSEDLGKQLFIILHQTLKAVRREPTLIVTALRLIEREERMDQAWRRKKEQTGFMPPGRPKNWRQRGFDVFEESITATIEGNQLDDRTGDKMWLVKHLELTRQLMIDNLKVVKTLLPPVFPPEYHIVKRYVHMYHKALGVHLVELIDQELEGNEIVSLLQWVHAYDSPDLLRHPGLNIDTRELGLGPLLENSVIEDLQNHYLKNMKTNIAEWTRNALKSDYKDWFKDEQPEADADGFYNTPLPVIIFQMMEQNLQVAQLISQDLVKKVLELFADELRQYAVEYEGEIKNFKERHLGNRNEQKYFLHYVIANANNCLCFGEYMKQLRMRYLKNEYEEEEGEEETDIRRDSFQQLTDTFSQISRLCCKIILDEFFIDLKDSNCLNELMTRAWMASSNAIDIICATWADYNEDFLHLRPKNFDMLVTTGQRKILTEYLRALLSRKLSFKNYKERRESADKMLKEATCLKDLFHHVSPKQDNSIFDVLYSLAEVLKLRDNSMLSLEVTGLVKKNPDIRLEQLINLILCRGDMNKSEARQMAVDTLGEDDANNKPKGIFSELANS